MNYQTVFKRFEMKYLISPEQYGRVLAQVLRYMSPDRYHISSVRNIYYDSESYRLIRRSIEKPAYKEKLRLRSYNTVSGEENVFVEIKKKYESVVYKRRIALPYTEAQEWIENNSRPSLKGQIVDEIDYFKGYYGPLRPTVYLSYDRVAYHGDSGLRITFDTNILARTDGLSLSLETGGERLLPEEKRLMEIKCTGGIPLWLTEVLSAERIYKTPFSKYGTSYTKLIFSSK